MSGNSDVTGNNSDDMTYSENSDKKQSSTDSSANNYSGGTSSGYTGFNGNTSGQRPGNSGKCELHYCSFDLTFQKK